MAETARPLAPAKGKAVAQGDTEASPPSLEEFKNADTARSYPQQHTHRLPVGHSHPSVNSPTTLNSDGAVVV